jgi:hypothetical protein
MSSSLGPTHSRAEHLADLLDREHAHQVGGGAERSAVDLRQAEGRVVRGDDDVARAREADAAAENVAVAGRDDGHEAVVDGCEGVPAAGVHLGDEAAVGRELLDVGAGAEALPLGRQDDALHVIVLSQGRDGLGDLVPARAVGRVHRGMVDVRLGDTVFDLDGNGHVRLLGL